jgi:16S rRNA (uracil1498-N3)-methyltransferase
VSPPLFHADLADIEAGSRIVLAGDEGRHAADVRRLRVGEAVDLADGRGGIAHGVVAETRRGQLTIEVKDRAAVPAGSPRLTVVQAMARGGRDELAVEAMTEVGVDHVLGWEAARNVAHWTERTQAKWTATAHAAAKQSRRAWWPEISGPATTADVAAYCASADLAVVLHEAATTPLSALQFPAVGQIVVTVGPEGGITDDELAMLAASGAHAVRLGDEVLRSSTAGVAALSVINARTRWR